MYHVFQDPNDMIEVFHNGKLYIMDEYFDNRVDECLKKLLEEGKISRYERTQHFDELDKCGVDFVVYLNKGQRVDLSVKSTKQSAVKEFYKYIDAGWYSKDLRLVSFSRDHTEQELMCLLMQSIEFSQIPFKRWEKVLCLMQEAFANGNITSYRYSGGGQWLLQVPNCDNKVYYKTQYKIGQKIKVQKSKLNQFLSGCHA